MGIRARMRSWRWVRRTLAVLGTIGILGWVSMRMMGCGPSLVGTPDQVRGLDRETVTLSDGRALSYLRAGDPTRPRVIYVHGTPGDAEAFADFLITPVSGLEAVSVDRPGFGRSGPKRAVTSFKEQAEALVPLLVERDGKWPILVGHSLGGPIVARLAADHPDKVRGVIIVAGSLDPAEEKIGFLQGIAQTSAVRCCLPYPLDNSLLELRDAKGETTALAGVLGNIRCPVIVIHGTEDPLVPYSNVAYIRKTFTGTSVEVVTLPEQNHFIPWERPDTIRDAVARMVAR